MTTPTRTVKDVARDRAQAWVTEFGAQLDRAFYEAGAYQNGEPGAFVDGDVLAKRRRSVVEMVLDQLEGSEIVIPQWLGQIALATVQGEVDTVLEREAGRKTLVNHEDD